MDFSLRIITLLLFALWQGYWWITEKKADREKPKKHLKTKLSYVKRYGLHFIVYSIILLQVLGFPIFTFNFNSQVLGLVLVVVGISISISGRIVLGTNWAHAAEYQIKKGQVLITNGIYRYIRNPIYTGLWFALTGAELVAKSYLFIIILFFGFWVAYSQAKREEKILEEYFGKEYLDYKKKSKMLIPFIF